MYFFSPLEQFSINKIIPIFIGVLDFSITNSTLLVILSCSCAFFLYSSVITGSRIIPTPWQIIVESLYEFIFYNVLSENIKKNGSLYFPFLFTIFSFILFCNLFYRLNIINIMYEVNKNKLKIWTESHIV